MRQRALEQWRHDTLLWAVTAPYVKESSRRRQPDLPEILKERRNGDA